MFGVTTLTTLSVIEAQIKQLEFDYMTVGSSQNLLIELGNAYKVKMMLVNEMESGTVYKETLFSKIKCPSKLNNTVETFEFKQIAV